MSSRKGDFYPCCAGPHHTKPAALCAPQPFYTGLMRGASVGALNVAFSTTPQLYQNDFLTSTCPFHPHQDVFKSDSSALSGCLPTNMARVYADVNQQMPRAYWDYDSVNISWGVLENYEIVRKIGAHMDMSSNTYGNAANR